MARKTLTDELESSRVLIFNSRGAEAAPLLNEMGIDAAYPDAGEALYKEAAVLVTQFKVSTDRLKNEKLDELDDYCTKLKAIAEVALEKKPQPLEQLGIVVPP